MSFTMVMKSRFCAMFRQWSSQSFQPNYHSSTIVNHLNLNFSVAVWKPFLDVESLDGSNNNASSIFCGPMLGLVVLIANLVHANLTWVGDIDVDENLLESGQIDVLLQPTFPSEYVNRTIFGEAFRLSRTLGDTAMLSILSTQLPLSNVLSLHSFSPNYGSLFQYLFLLFWLSIRLIALALNSRTKHQRPNIGLDLFRIACRQPVLRFTSVWSYHSFLAINFLLLSFFVHQFVSNIFLKLFTFREKMDRIDQLEDLVRRPTVKLVTFPNEIGTVIAQSLSQENPFFKNFQNRMIQMEPNVSDYNRWEKDTLHEVAHNRLALISDQLYLDFKLYKYRSYRPDYSNLYRSASNQFVRPYFLATRRTDRLLQNATDRIIGRLFQAGLFKLWVDEVLFHNQPHLLLDPCVDLSTTTNYQYKMHSNQMYRLHNRIAQTYRALSLADLRFFVYFYWVASGVAVTVLIFEIVWKSPLLKRFCTLLASAWTNVALEWTLQAASLK